MPLNFLRSSLPVSPQIGPADVASVSLERPAALLAVAIFTLSLLSFFFFMTNRARREAGLYGLFALGVALHVAAAAPAWLPLPTGLLSPLFLTTLSFLLPPLGALFVSSFVDQPLALWQKAALVLPLAALGFLALAPEGEPLYRGVLASFSLAFVATACAAPLLLRGARKRPENALVFVGVSLLTLSALLSAVWQGQILVGEPTHFPAVGSAFLIFTLLLLFVVVDQNHRLVASATTDALTNLANRAEFWRRAEAELLRARRTERSVALVILDLDHFKSVNDTYGHPVGDRVLAAAAGAIAQTLRGIDVSGRYGGEEFIVLLVEVDEASALKAVERLREAISTLAPPRVPRQVTVSAGIALHHPLFERSSIRDLVRRADAALYQSKKGGRNRATLESSRSGPPATAAEVRFR